MSPYVSGKQTYGDRILPDARQDKGGKGCTAYVEEPCISGEHGSGAIFFSGCTLRCVFCQNYKIAAAAVGKYITVDGLADIMLRLQDKHANNINLVTPTHYALHIAQALTKARDNGLRIPVVYNTSAY